MNAGALEAVDRILNRGGGDDDVLRAVVDVLHERLGGRFVRISPGPAAGDPAEPVTTFAIVSQRGHLADLEVGGPLDSDDRETLERVALLVSPYAATP